MTDFLFNVLSTNESYKEEIECFQCKKLDLNLVRPCNNNECTIRMHEPCYRKTYDRK